MGLFDQGNKKKKKDDFGSPVEKIDLSAAAAAPAEREIEIEADEPDAPAEPPPARRRSAVEYGIDDAIALMRTLPAENVELVVRVVKHTLESTNIAIPAIIEDASAKQERIEARIKVLRDEIADLEQQIEVRKKEIDELETDHLETTEVKERLVLAEQLGQSQSAQAAAPRPVAASSSAGQKPRAADLARRGSPSTAPPPPPDSSRATTIVQKK